MNDLTSLVNGEPLETVKISDRGFMYGDGLFETMRVTHGKIGCWPLHMQRLVEGCRRLAIPIPNEVQLADEADRLVSDREAGVLKLVVTRGPDGRGYKSADKPSVTRVMTLHSVPDYPDTYPTSGVHVRLCNTRLSHNPLLAGIKHLNRLEQVLARLEWEDETIAEGLMLDYQGHIIEGVMSNLFMAKGDRLITPDLSYCGVAGIARSVCLAAAKECKIPVAIKAVREADLYLADEVFLTNSINGIWPVQMLDNHGFSPGEITRRLMERFNKQLNMDITWKAS